MNRQKRLLFILLVGLLLAAAYAFWAAPRQQRLPLSADGNPPGRSRAVNAAPGGEVLSQVQLELLTRAGEETYGGYRRNIFAPLYRAVAVAPSAPTVARVETPAPPPPPVLEVPTAPLEQEAIRRELARFTFLGFLQKDAVKTVFLSTGDEIFVVKRGDRFGQGRQFLVTHISNEVLQVRQGEDPRTISVPLVEQAPLVEGRATPSSPRPAVFPEKPSPARSSPPPPPELDMEESFPSPEPQGGGEEVYNE